MARKKKNTRGNGHSVPSDLDAVKSIVDILEMFMEDDQHRILRWVREKIGMGVDGSVAVEQPNKQLAVTATVPTFRRVVRNPHMMAKPPLNKVMIQDDDEGGELIGIPADRYVPEPPEADILKPNKETRRLVSVTHEHVSKDGKKVVTSRSLVMR